MFISMSRGMNKDYFAAGIPLQSEEKTPYSHGALQKQFGLRPLVLWPSHFEKGSPNVKSNLTKLVLLHVSRPNLLCNYIIKGTILDLLGSVWFR